MTAPSICFSPAIYLLVGISQDVLPIHREDLVPHLQLSVLLGWAPGDDTGDDHNRHAPPFLPFRDREPQSLVVVSAKLDCLHLC